jgi:hypothetical protein
MKTLLTILAAWAFFVHSIAQTKAEEKAAITNTIQAYFDGMMDRDLGKLEEAFFGEARLIGYRGEKLTVTEFRDWAANTAKGEKRDRSHFKNQIHSIEIKGDTALVKTELWWPGIYYFDFLTLMKIDGKWKIVHKTWYEEKR